MILELLSGGCVVFKLVKVANINVKNQKLMGRRKEKIHKILKVQIKFKITKHL